MFFFTVIIPDFFFSYSVNDEIIEYFFLRVVFVIAPQIIAMQLFFILE